MRDEDIFRLVRNGQHDKVVRLLYREFPKVKALIARSGGDEGQAREVFHDSLLITIEKLADRHFTLSANLTTYLYGVNRLLWMNRLRKKQRNPEVEWPDTLIVTDSDLGLADEKEARIAVMEQVLGSISERCRQILELFYLQGQSMERIASALGFSNVNSAKTQKYKCMEHAIGLANEFKTTNA